MQLVEIGFVFEIKKSGPRKKRSYFNNENDYNQNDNDDSESDGTSSVADEDM